MLRSVLMAVLALALAAPLSAGDVPPTKEEKALNREVRGLQKQLEKLEKRYNQLLLRCRGDERNRADARACDTARVTYQDAQAVKDRINTLTKS